MRHLLLASTILVGAFNANAQNLMGAYVGVPGMNAEANNAYKAVTDMIGTPTVLTEYVDSTGPMSTWASSAQWSAGLLAQTPNKASSIPSVGIPMAQAGQDADTAFKAIANGSQDAVFNGIFKAYADAGFKNFYIRPGWEMNGNWEPWSVTPANAADFNAAFQRIATLAHQFQGAAILTVWNPAAGGGWNGAINTSSYYPGNAAVDVIGIDQYAANGAPESAPFDTTIDPTQFTLKGALAMAVANNKPFALPEVGAGTNDTTFAGNMASVIKASGAKIAYVALWDCQCGGTEPLMPTDNGAAAASWKQAFQDMGINTATGPTSPTPTTTRPTPTTTTPTTNQPTTTSPTLTGGCSDATGAIGPATGQFYVKDGKIVAPDGTQFIEKGIDIWDWSMGDFDAIMAKFPGTNMIRIAVGGGTGYAPPSYFADIIAKATAAHVYVQIGNYTTTQTELSGQALQDAANWTASLAAAYKNNPYVGFSTLNEPQNGGGGTVSAEHQAIYNAVRATGSNAIVAFDAVGAYQTDGLDPSVYSKMKNVIWDEHFYNWTSGFSTDVQANLAAMAKATASLQSITSADGTIPVIIGEWGNSTTGSGTDPGGDAAVQAVLQSGLGYTAWAWNPGGSGDQLITNGSLTKFGSDVAAAIASGCSTILSSAPQNQTQDIYVASQTPTIQDIYTQALQQPNSGTPEAPSLHDGTTEPQTQPRTVSSPTGISDQPPTVTNAVTFTTPNDGETVTVPSGNATGTITANNDTVTIVGGSATVVVTGTGNSVTTGPYDDTITVRSQGNTINAGGGADTVVLDYPETSTATDEAKLLADLALYGKAGTNASAIITSTVAALPALSSQGNVIVAPSPGTGTLTIQGTLSKSDRIDLTKALAGTTWDGSMATIWDFVDAKATAGGCTLSIGGQTIVTLPSGSPNDNIGPYMIARHG